MTEEQLFIYISWAFAGGIAGLVLAGTLIILKSTGVFDLILSMYYSTKIYTWMKQNLGKQWKLIRINPTYTITSTVNKTASMYARICIIKQSEMYRKLYRYRIDPYISVVVEIRIVRGKIISIHNALADRFEMAGIPLIDRDWDKEYNR